MKHLVVPRLPAPGERLGLEAGASHHLLHVLRTPRGAKVQLTDGLGATATAILEDVTDGQAWVRGQEQQAAPRSTRRVAVIGLAKPALIEDAVVMGTEVGVTELRLVVSRYSPPARPRLDRLERLIEAAMQQSGRAQQPTVGVLSWEEALTGLPACCLIATPHAPSPAPTEGELAIAIGPEGGWSPDEQLRFERAGFVPAGLGAHILRVPTALVAGFSRYGRP